MSKYKTDAAEIVERIRVEYAVEDVAGKFLLDSLERVLATEFEASEAIERDGLLVEDRFGQKREHPAFRSLRDSRSQKLAVLKALGLDLVETNNPGPGRPPRRY
jgi:hypothetical protein